MAIITDLPNELLEEVCLAVRRQSRADGKLKSDLRNFSMVCRAFYRVSFRHIYDVLDLTEGTRCSASELSLLISLIDLNPERGYVVQQLSIGPWDPAEYSPRWSKSESFKRSYALLKRTIEAGKIQHEDIDGLVDYPPGLLVTILLYLMPNVDDLYLVMTPTGLGKPLGTRWLLLAMDIAPLPCREKVKRLDLEYLQSNATTGLVVCRLTMGALLACPNLKIMRCSEDESEVVDRLLELGTGDPNPIAQRLQELELSPVDAPVEVLLSPELADAHKRFTEYDPLCMDRIRAIEGTSPLTGISFYNNFCTIWCIPDIIRVAKGLKEFDCYISTRTQNTREHILGIHLALLANKATLKDIMMTYYKGYGNRHVPNFQLDFSEFEKLKILQVSLILLADIDATVVQIGDVLPSSLKTLTLKIRYSTLTGPSNWDVTVLQVLKNVARLKEMKLPNLKAVDVRVINHPARRSKSENLKVAREMMEESGIK
ncbi:hypothetical protein ABW20_dc0108825 [Dactylellina cionopaga]|nr:hypothetical protein ABW20_dc0108825 [Dactylellina cionopaga]